MKKRIILLCVAALAMSMLLAACDTPPQPASEPTAESKTTTTTATESETTAMTTTTTAETEGATTVTVEPTSVATGHPTTASKTSTVVTTKKTTARVKKSAEEILKQYSASFLKSDKYSLSKYMLPLWDSDIIFNEQVLPVEDENGDILLPLLYDPLQIVSVYNNTLKKQYTEGTDYVLEGNKLRILKTGKVDWLPYGEIVSDHYEENKFVRRFINEEPSDEYIRVAAEGWFQARYLHVTYVHNDAWQGDVPAYVGDRLPKTMAKLKGKQPTQIVIYGDSISHGDGATGYCSLAPKMPVWSEMLQSALKSVYSDKVTVTNLSVGGWTSTNGVNGGTEVYQRIEVPGAKERVGSLKPDLVILGFGHNDGTIPQLTLDNLNRIISDIRSVSPDTEFLVLGVTYQNPQFSNGNPSNPGRMCDLQRVYDKVLKDVEKSGAVFLPIKTIEDTLLSRKPSWDIQCNNINHPNDFFYRFYAQIVCKALISNF